MSISWVQLSTVLNRLHDILRMTMQLMQLSFVLRNHPANNWRIEALPENTRGETSNNCFKR